MLKKLLITGILLTAVICFVQSGKVADAFSAAKTDNSVFVQKTPVMVELFTSESCASCPPAEKMLAKLEREQPFAEAELITLAFHVDYRDGFGWKDKYASPLFTQRQKVYDRKFRTGYIYTPQMVVDGDIEFTGSNEKKAEKAVEKSLKNKKAEIGLSFDKDGKLNVKISKVPEHSDATIYLAVAEDGINTRVRGGENSGKDLSHVSLVRSLNGLGRILSTQNSFEVEKNLYFEPDWKKENLRMVVFVQENGSRNILGVGRISPEITSENRNL